MSIKDNYYIRQIEYSEAMEIVVKNHYLHRKPPCTVAYGLFEIGGGIVGCITYGCPPSRNLQRGICGNDEADNVIELNRLWVSETVPKNGESYLVSHTIKLLPYEIIVSFADTSYGHIGYIYQATNFLYTGLTAKRTEWAVKGQENRHTRTLSNVNPTIEDMKRTYGDNFYYRDRPQKHRYIYFNADKKRKKELMSKLKYPILPYPKGNTDVVKTVFSEEEVQVQYTLLDYMENRL